MSDVTTAQCEEIIAKFEPTATGKDSKQLSIDGNSVISS